MKLFVDDIRACPQGWTPAKTVTEAIRILATREVEEVSLDHDIQCEHKIPEGWTFEIGNTKLNAASPETFEPVARYISAVKEVMHGMQWSIKVTFHTSNFDAGRKMAAILGIPYVVRWYPTDFIDGHCQCCVFPDIAKKAPCTYCKSYQKLTGEYPGHEGVVS